MGRISVPIIVLCFLLFTGYAGQPSGGEERVFKEKIAVFPFENLSDNKDATASVMPVVNEKLKSIGLEIIDEDSIKKFLIKNRVRSTGYISKDLARKMAEELNVKAILLGSVVSFSRGENPKLGLLARLIDSSNGSILWADYASATGEDFSKIMGLGRLQTVDRLIPAIVGRLFASFSTVSSKERESTYRIAVMPFQNKSGFRDAGIIATYMFLTELFKNPRFEPVEYGEVRRLLIDLRVRSRGELDYQNIKMISESLSLDGILVGTVELYSDGSDTSSPPTVAITVRLLDARKNRIFLYNSLQLSGEDEIIVFDWGRIRSVDKVAYKVVSKLVKKMETPKWH